MHRTSELFRDRVLLPALSAPSGLPRLRAIFHGWLRWATDTGLDGGCPLNAARVEFDDQPPGEVRDALVAGWNEWLSYLERQAAKASELKQTNTPLSPRQVVQVTAGLVSAGDTRLRLLGDRHAIRESERAFDLLFSS